MNDPRDGLTAGYRRIVWPSLAANGTGAALAIVYMLLTYRLPDGLELAAALLAAGTSGLVIAVTAVVSSLSLKTQRTLREADGKLSPDLLQAAIREVLAFPDRVFFFSLVGWVIAVTSVGVGLKLLTAAPGLGPLPRVLLVGLLCGPISALLAHLMAVVRAREFVLVLAGCGLSAQQVLEAVPVTRTQLRARLVLFAAICVLTPAVLTADLSSALAHHTLEDVAAVTTGAQAQVAAQLRMDGMLRVAGMGLFVLGLALITAYVGGTVIGGPMRQIAEEATRIAGGSLESPRVIPADDEVWAVSAAFTAMQGNLTGVLRELKRAGVQIGSTTEEIVTTSSQYEEGAAEQATALNETSATTEELARSARQIAENAGSMAEIAQKTLAAAQAGQQSAEAFSQSMDRMQQDNRAIADSVTKLNKRIVQIGRIVEFINGVADKSDLLALNAELEGTKAGDVGRGFSLVAAEMRRLAENVLESTKEIEGLIEEIREATQAAVNATEAGVRATDSGGSLALAVSHSLNEIVQLAGQTFDAVRSISLATQQQQTGTDQLAEAMADILRVTQQSLMATKQVSTANVDLISLAQDLRTVVGRFRISEGGGAQ